MCRYCTLSTKTKHPVLTRPISNPQNPFSAPQILEPRFCEANRIFDRQRAAFVRTQDYSSAAVWHGSSLQSGQFPIPPGVQVLDAGVEAWADFQLTQRGPRIRTRKPPGVWGGARTRQTNANNTYEYVCLYQKHTNVVRVHACCDTRRAVLQDNMNAR